LPDGQKWTNPLTGEVVIVGETTVTDENMNPKSPYIKHNEVQYTVTKTGAVNVSSRTYIQTTKHTVIEQKTSTAFATATDNVSKDNVANVTKGVSNYLKQLGSDEVAVGIDINISDAGLNKKELNQFRRKAAAEIKKQFNIDVKFTYNQQSFSTDEKGANGKETGKKVQNSGISVNVTTNKVKLEENEEKPKN
jgi:hypothetical protein